MASPYVCPHFLPLSLFAYTHSLVRAVLAYIITNLIFSFRQGRGVWKTSVSESFSRGGGGRIPSVRTGSGFDDGFEKDRMALPGGGGYGQQQQQQYAPVSTYNDGTYTGYDGRTQVHV